ncbi:LacI family transcriptional regulator [Roseibium aquae]|uniref:LacI family transcriptional regulator n=1 Tax=Roseibium aquae TaxID=1323746 RepID=A0A916X0L9_9HYPH|nr:LacI family DNA-binding transcriptional regulator [Roseibium aquae]GGB44069.1 LacI family transcriptional regulator [Roseibium aquae]
MDKTHSSGGRPVPTVADVAAAAGVSTATVSRCLNSPTVVSEKTLKRVMEAVERLGYSPNFSARALASNRTNMVGAIIPTMENAIFARGLQAFQEELQRHGRTLLVASSSYRLDLEEQQIKTLSARGADALLLIGYQRDARIYDYLEKRDIPVVLTWASRPDSGLLSVGFDNRKAMKQLADMVIQEGYTAIGCISAETGTNDRARDRVEGIRAAMRDAHLDPGTLQLIETTYSIENGEAAFAQLMSGAAQPEVVMCGNDVLAIGALKGAASLGLRVPEDVAITGFDDIELAQVAPYPLTTVHVPHRRMGQLAARVLVETLDGLEPPSVELPVEICRRQTL